MLNSNIAKLRKKHGLTQIEFAKQLHVTQAAVSHWENGRANPDTFQLFKIAQFFNMSVDELSGNEVSAPVKTETKKEPVISDELEDRIVMLCQALEITPDELKKVLDFADLLKAARKS